LRSILKVLFVVTIGSVVMLSSFAAGYGTRWYFGQSTPTVEEAADFTVFWEAWHILEGNFYGELPESPQMVYGAIRGVLGLLDDRHTIHVEPEPRQLEKDNLKGSFGGIGAYVRRTENGQIAIEVMADAPAMRAGLQDDDIIVKVDDTEIAPEMSEQDVVLLIRGPIGEPVTLTISRSGSPEPFEVKVIRERIETPSVEWEVLDGNIGYVSIGLFGERTSEELSQALGELKDSQITGLVLDLRSNPGGLLNAAVDVAGQFIGRKVVLHERKPDGSEKTYTSSRGATVADVPLVLLVDQNTASASEIVAGALQDVIDAPLVGETTFGKGSVQLVYDLSDGSSLHVTVAHWFTPEHHQIQGEGLTPDYEVTMDPIDQDEEQDPQLDKALELLSTDPVTVTTVFKEM
jgi:carboxyl-terminal processing protease